MKSPSLFHNLVHKYCAKAVLDVNEQGRLFAVFETKLYKLPFKLLFNPDACFLS